MKRSAASSQVEEPASKRQKLVLTAAEAADADAAQAMEAETGAAAEAVAEAVAEAEEAEGGEQEETGSSDLFGSETDDSDSEAIALSRFRAAAASTIVDGHDESQPEASATDSEAEQETGQNCLVWRSEVMAFMLRFLGRNFKREPTAFPKKLLDALDEGYAKHQSRKARDPHCEAAERAVAVQLCAQYTSDQIQPGRPPVNFRGSITWRASERGAGGGGGGGGGGGDDDDVDEEETHASCLGNCAECDRYGLRVWQYTDG